ncbi:MAG: hypothetical protein QOJ35_1047 [Solirubrobacteraceae bacterium]|nr:hypothetical protein [Solirubrobacteraceae bacterium]
MRVASWRGRVAVGLCGLAVVYSAGLLLVIAVIPPIDDQTLLQYGGSWSLAIFAEPLLVSALLWRLLRRRCHTGSDRSTMVAWLLATVYLVYSVLGGLSTAAGAFPSALLIFLAVALTPRAPATDPRSVTGP